MPRLFIPELGTHLELTGSWSFSLFYERRNASLLTHFGYLIPQEIPVATTRWNYVTREIEPYTYMEQIFIRPNQELGLDHNGQRRERYYGSEWIQSDRHENVTLPAGTILTVDRLYLRRKQEEFSSVTFAVKHVGGKKIPRGRFWVKLHQVNQDLYFREVAANPTPKKNPEVTCV